MKYLVIVSISLIIAACGKDDGSPQSKSLFSYWQNENLQLDLRTAGFGTYGIRFEYTSNSGCDCQLDISGTQSAGTAIIFNCMQYGPVNYCTAGATIYDYTKTATTLTVCEGGNGCEVLK